MKKRMHKKTTGSLIDYVLRLEYLSMPAIQPRRDDR